MSGESWLGSQICCRSDHNEWTELARTPNIRLYERPLNEWGELARSPNIRL